VKVYALKFSVIQFGVFLSTQRLIFGVNRKLGRFRLAGFQSEGTILSATHSSPRFVKNINVVKTKCHDDAGSR
jgi:hypothetical protein